MIYPASTFLLASLVVNAASVLGAPLRIPPASQPIARAVDSDPILVERMKIVPVPPSQRSVDPDPTEGRSIHQSREIVPEIANRNTASYDEVEARDPLPEIEEIVRRFPRRALYERHEKRSHPSSPPEARSPSPEPESSPPVERRFFRRALFERHQPRADPPPPTAPEQNVRRFPRKILAEYYAEKRTPAPEPVVVRELEPEPVVARSPEPQPELVPDQPAEAIVRRFARRGMAERVEARQVPDDSTPPPPAPPTTPSSASSPPEGTVVNAAPTPTSSGVVSVATPSPVPQPPVVPTSGNPVVEIIHAQGANKAANFIGLPSNGLPVEVDREHETTVYHQKTTEHITQCGEKGAVTPNPPVTPPGSSPVVPPSSVPSGVPIPPVAQPSNTPPTPVQQGGNTPPVPSSSSGADGTSTPLPTPSGAPVDPSATDVPPSSVTDGTSNPGDPPVTPPARRDENLADPVVLRGRSLGYSGPAWASYLKRSVNMD